MSARTEIVISASLIAIVIIALMSVLEQNKQTKLMQEQVQQTEKHYKFSVYPQLDICKRSTLDLVVNH